MLLLLQKCKKQKQLWDRGFFLTALGPRILPPADRPRWLEQTLCAVKRALLGSLRHRDRATKDSLETVKRVHGFPQDVLDGGP